MTTGAFVRLIFLKDVRRFAWLLGLALGLTIVLALHATETATFPYVFLSALLVYLLGLFLVIDSIQLDWPGRDLRFLSTRPVPGEAIFFAKILFLGLFLILSGWGFQELDYFALDVPLQPLDHLCVLIETTVHFGTGMALVVLFTIFLRKNVHVVLGLCSVVGAIPFLAFLGMFFPQVAAFAPERNHAQLYFGAVVGLALQSGFIGVALLATLVRYRTHKFGLPLALVIGGIVLDLLLCYGADKIGERCLANDQTSHMPPYLRDQIRLTNYSSPEQTEQTTWNLGIIYHTVVRGPNIEGIEAPYYYKVVGYQSTATLRSGKIIRSVVEQNLAPAQDIGNLMGVPFEAEVIGVSSKIPGVSYGKPGATLRAFTYLPSLLPAKEDLTGVTIKGEVQLEIHRAYVVGSIPLETGAVFTQPRQRCEITGLTFKASAQEQVHPISLGGLHIAPSPGGVVLDLKYANIPLTLRGDIGDKSGDLCWALVSRSRNEIAQIFTGSNSNTSFPLSIATSSMLYSSPGGQALPPDWLKGAELVFLGNETCGRVTVPYEVDNVTLTR